MNIDIEAVHFTLTEDSRDYVHKKIDHIHNAENMIVDLLLRFIHEKDFTAEATVNFRWGVSVHIQERDFDLTPAVDKLMEKLQQKITKEKEKAQERR